jgi:hypothetical protein
MVRDGLRVCGNGKGDVEREPMKVGNVKLLEEFSHNKLAIKRS